MSNTKDRNSAKKWVEHWKTAGKSLEDLRHAELTGNDYYANQFHVFDQMLQYRCEQSRERKHSGLVEQQRLFARLRPL